VRHAGVQVHRGEAVRWRVSGRRAGSEVCGKERAGGASSVQERSADGGKSVARRVEARDGVRVRGVQRWQRDISCRFMRTRRFLRHELAADMICLCLPLRHLP